MNIALTGSSGLLGSQLLKDLQVMGHKVLCISSSISSPDKNIYLYEDLSSKEINFKADFLIHLASINSNLKKSEMDQEIAILHNAIKCMGKLDCRNIIFFSTIKVYGENSFDLNLIDENSSQHPECFYGKAKVRCEKEIIKLSQTNKFNYLIFRLPPILIDHPKSNLGKIFSLVKNGFPIPSFSAGDFNQRSFLKFELLAYVIEEVLKKEVISSSNIFNICDTKPISTNDLLRRFGKSINKKARIIYLPNFIFKAMIKVNRLQLILCRIFGNFSLSNAKLKTQFRLPDHF